MERVEILRAYQLFKKEMRNAECIESPHIIRELTDTYYLIQKMRIRQGNQVMASQEEDIGEWMRLYLQMFETMEQVAASALRVYAGSTPLGRWCMANIGIGPILTAGLLAHIEIEQAPSVLNIWRFAGMDPTCVWEKGQKRPWNAALRRLGWLIGESFVKVSGNPKSLYGRLYLERKAYELACNEEGRYESQAKERLARNPRSRESGAWKKGKLSQGHIHSRAKRWTVKLFLSHFHSAAMVLKLGKEPPVPYAIAHLGHVHYVAPEVDWNLYRE